MVDDGVPVPALYPNRRQRLLIERTFGCTRWVWNHSSTSVRSNTRRPAEARARSGR